MATCTVHVYATKYPDIRKEKRVQITIIPPPKPKPALKPTPTPVETQTQTSPPINGDGTPFTANTLLYVILGLLFTGVIIAAILLWRRGKRGTETEDTETHKSENEQKGDTEKKRPNSSIAKWIATIIILILILASAIFIVSSLKPPEVSVKTVSIKGFESIDLIIMEVPTEAIFSVVLDVYNPNFIGATVTDVQYDLYVNDVHVGKGSLPRPVTIPANDRTNVETEVSISVSSSIQALITAVQQKSATARVEGDVHISIPILGRISVPFSEEQRLV